MALRIILCPSISSSSCLIGRSTATFRRKLSGYKGKADRVGEFKSPIVKELWNQRLAQSTIEDAEIGDPIEKVPSASQTSITYKFASDLLLRQSYQNPWLFMRKGRLFEDLDALAGTIAFKHCERNNRVPLLVTASVDRIRLSRNPKLDVDMHMSGKVVWTGHSSLQINMQVVAENEASPWITADFTFVARCPQTGKATKINPLKCESPEDKALFDELESKNQKRKAKRLSEGGNNNKRSTSMLKKEGMIKLLLDQARPLIEMPVLASPTTVLIDATRLSNSTIMQPQQRNMLNRIFGGFLMRRSYEIAFSTCYLFGGSQPEFSEVAHVDFLAPVDVGDLMRFDSAVLYTRVDSGVPEVHVQVVASICRPEEVQSQVSNTFNFIFTLPGKSTCRKVLPGNLDQAIRVVERMEAHKEVRRADEE